jgi:hypothetical protein
MQITLELSEDIAERLESRWKDLLRAALESLALRDGHGGSQPDGIPVCRAGGCARRVPAGLITVLAGSLGQGERL